MLENMNNELISYSQSCLRLFIFADIERQIYEQPITPLLRPRRLTVVTLTAYNCVMFGIHSRNAPVHPKGT